MKTNNNLDNFSDIRVVNLLTPRFAPTTSLEFKAPAPRRRTLWQVARIGAVAAVVAVGAVAGIGLAVSKKADIIDFGEIVLDSVPEKADGISRKLSADTHPSPACGGIHREEGAVRQSAGGEGKQHAIFL